MKNIKDLEETLFKLAETHIKRGTKRSLRISIARRTWRKQFSHLLTKKQFICLYNAYINNFSDINKYRNATERM